ncbi:hypothetical protein [Micromonospora coerulea]|uniref:hypothetical protein n=1 Tax=Micromonospora coerulea TaxID=47856 RepID=UPI001903A05D|nr:hypothetical protein [Micromonospora veneta]
MSQPQPPTAMPPSASEFCEQALTCLQTGDWRGAYRWAKGWIGSGGGTHIEPWLVYVASTLTSEKARDAVHSIDLAVGLWLPGAQDRAAMLWLRGCIVHRRLNDPRTALRDLLVAGPALPVWLANQRDAEIAACEEAARHSRKRVPSVKQAWSYSGQPETLRFPDHAHEPRSDGEAPDRRLINILVDLGLPVA